MAGTRRSSILLSTIRAWLIPLGKLWTLLVVLPWILTYAHLRYGLVRTETCFVGPTDAAIVDQRRIWWGEAVTKQEGVVHDSTNQTIMTTWENVDQLYGAYRPLGPPSLSLSPLIHDNQQKQLYANANGRLFLLVDRPARSSSPSPSSFLFAWMPFTLGRIQ